MTRPAPARVSLLVALAIPCLSLPASAQSLPPVPEPVENPITEAKRVLGKILFWDTQLSSDDSIACGTCHAPAASGADPRLGLHPGADGIFGNADDVVGSPGVVRRDSNGDPIPDPVFGFAVQVTGRAAPNFFGGLWAPQNFWDGRATDEFRDPLTDQVLIATGGALESQAVGPILSDVEMAKEGRTWQEVTDKLATVTPMLFATDLPADMAAAVTQLPTYPQLFEDAFGDPAITPARIGFAIATYERTLVADDTPWDAFIAGDTNALTPLEQQGWNFFQGSRCNVCHVAPLFTDNDFHTLGVRDPSEDDGRQSVTGDVADRGRFKTPTLRGVGLKPTYMHTGEFSTLAEVIVFYQPGNQVPENLDPLMPVPVPGNQRLALGAFLASGLTDPAVENETFPFDRPTLLTATAVPALPAPALWILGAGIVAAGRFACQRR